MTLEELVENFELLGDWEERYGYIIDLGRKLPPMPEGTKTDETIVPGCISRVWMISKTHENPLTLEFLADSDAHIMRGLIGILLALYSHKTPEEILAINVEDIFTRLQLQEHLSPNRRNGFLSMIQRIQSTAQARLSNTPTNT